MDQERSVPSTRERGTNLFQFSDEKDAGAKRTPWDAYSLTRVEDADHFTIACKIIAFVIYL
jgi:hypothetical protein